MSRRWVLLSSPLKELYLTLPHTALSHVELSWIWGGGLAVALHLTQSHQLTTVKVVCYTWKNRWLANNSLAATTLDSWTSRSTNQSEYGHRRLAPLTTEFCNRNPCLYKCQILDYNLICTFPLPIPSSTTIQNVFYWIKCLKMLRGGRAGGKYSYFYKN